MTKKTEIMDLFVQQWNGGHDFQISKKSLYDWMQKSKSGQVEKLIDKRGGYNRGQSTIPEYYKNMFDSIYLQQTKPSIESCFKEVRLESSLKGDYIPGIKAFRNHVRNMNKAMVIRAREGKKAFDDKCMPYIERDYSLISPNDWWVSDHHLWDIFVRIPMVRAVGNLDVHGAVIGWICAQEKSCQALSESNHQIQMLYYAVLDLE